MKHPENQVSSVTRLCLVRHGETPWNIERRLQGHRDIDLNNAGRHQAQAAALWLLREPVDAVYSSDLLRAWHTAERLAVALGLERKPMPALRERRYGMFEGLTHVEAGLRFPDAFARHEARDPDFTPPGDGESLVNFYLRVTAALQGIAARHPGETVVAVTHGGVLDMVNRFVRHLPLSAPRDFAIPNAGLNWLTVRAGVWEIESWGEIAHLADLSLDEL
jgi:probable phosphoglycerate mutase